MEFDANNIVYESQDSLQHYGVLGMKWGVRRGRTQQAYKKASKKFQKLDEQATKAADKANKKSRKADAAINSSFASVEKIGKRTQEAEKAQRAYGKRLNKAKKWYEQMEKTFAETDVKLTSDQIELGKKYIERVNMRTELKYLRAGL